MWGPGEKEGSWTPRFPLEQLVTGVGWGWGGGGMRVGVGKAGPGRGSRRAQVVAVQGNVGELIGEVGLERGPAVTATTTQLQDES